MNTVTTVIVNERNRNLKNYAAISLAILGAQGFGFTLISSFLSFVYTEYLGVAAAAVGVVLSVGVLLDGVADFGMGIVMDRVHTKYGKARHWFLWMAIPLAVTTGLMFWAPAGLSTTGKIFFLFVVYSLYCISLSTTRLPANALTALISNDSRVRAKASFFVAIWATLGTTITGILVTPLLSAFGGGLKGYRLLDVLFAILTGICMLGAFFLVREMKSGDEIKREKARSGKKLSVATQFLSLVKNKYWLIQQGGVLSANIAFGFMMGTMSYFCMYVLKNMNMVGLMLGIFTVPMLVGAVISLPLSKKVDAKNVNIIGYVIALIGCLISGIFGLRGLAILVVGLIIRQLGTGFSTSVDAALSARTVEYGEWKNGIRQEGMVYSGKSVIQKISAALASALLGFVLTATGYVGGQGIIADSAVSAISFMFLKVPLITTAIALVAYCFFNLTDKKVHEMQTEILFRNSQVDNN